MADFLLVGGKGFLGKSFARWAVREGHACETVDQEEIDVAAGSKKLADLLLARPGRHILLMASKVGAKLFKAFPVASWIENSRMLANMVEATEVAGRSLGSVSWFSTSETYGSSWRKIENGKTAFKLDYSNPRSLYSQCKLAGETAFTSLLECGCLEKLRIFRPFNVFGPEQRRGVVYEMVVSAIRDKRVYYSAKTNRTLTPASYFAEAAGRSILSGKTFEEVDVSVPDYSVTMEVLAKTITAILKRNGFVDEVEIEEDRPDAAVRSRHTGRVHRFKCPAKLEAGLEETVVELAKLETTNA